MTCKYILWITFLSKPEHFFFKAVNLHLPPSIIKNIRIGACYMCRLKNFIRTKYVGSKV